MKTRTRPTVNRLAVLLALPLAALVGGCEAGPAPELPSGSAAVVTHTSPVPSVTDPVSAPEASPGASAAPTPASAEAGSAEPPGAAVGSAETTTALNQLDADLAELDTQLSEADRDLATPEGDF